MSLLPSLKQIHPGERQAEPVPNRKQVRMVCPDPTSEARSKWLWVPDQPITHPQDLPRQGTSSGLSWRDSSVARVLPEITGGLKRRLRMKGQASSALEWE